MVPPTIPPTAAALGVHARELAAAFKVLLIEEPRLKPEDAVSLPAKRLVVCAPVTDETTYAVALHEIGHQCAGAGVARTASTAASRGLMQVEEDAAWTWARHYALLWTPVMEVLATWAEATYTAPVRPPVPPPAPAKPVEHVDWSKFR